MTYFDNAATTFIDTQARNIIYKSLHDDNLNPSSLYQQGRDKFNEIVDCKKQIAINLGLSENDYRSIYFTSGGCEGNNWIIKGAIAEYYRYYQSEVLIYNVKFKKPHIITSSFEHHSVLNACKQLEDLGLAKVTYIKPSRDGIISAQDIEDNIELLTSDYRTILVSVMWVNNVLGTIQPIKEIGEICKREGIKFHTDAVQAVGNIDIDLSEYKIDFMTVSGHKFHAPKGIGFVYVNDDNYFLPMISGGGQEFGFRAGTENLPYIKAITYCFNKYTKPAKIFDKQMKMVSLKNELGLKLSGMENILIFKSSYEIGTVNVAFKDLISDALVYNLGERGYLVSVGSACDNGNFEDSHVLSSVGYNKDYINGNIRITFGDTNTSEEVNEFVNVLKEEVMELRGY